MAGRIKVLTWNLNAFTNDRTDEKLALLDRLDWDVALLQELLPKSIVEVRDHFPTGRLITRELADGWPNPPSRRRCAVLVRKASTFVAERIIDCVDGITGPEPKDCEAPRELLVAADIRIGNNVVTVVSAHPPHAAGESDYERAWRIESKLRTYAALERFVTPLDNVIVGMDANAWIDYMLFTQERWDDGSEQADVTRFFYETPARHGLRDALHVWFDTHPTEFATAMSNTPHGPLAVTHFRGKKHPVAERFDVIMVKPTFQVLSIEHNYEDAVAVGSDHAYVLAELVLGD